LTPSGINGWTGLFLLATFSYSGGRGIFFSAFKRVCGVAADYISGMRSRFRPVGHDPVLCFSPSLCKQLRSSPDAIFTGHGTIQTSFTPFKVIESRRLRGPF